MIGTIDHHLKDKVWHSNLTTPDPITLQKRIAEMLAAGAEAITFEVSSHAVEQNRVYGIPFNVVVFTNLTRDHLDYHKNMEQYFAVKQRLFTELLALSTKANKVAIINNDDVYGQKLEVSALAKTITYGKKSHVDYQINILQTSFDGTDYEVITPSLTVRGFLPVVGEFSVYNAVAAIAACVQTGMSVEASVKALESFKGVPGRVEKVKSNSSKNIFIDFAHTDDALASVLKSINEIKYKTEKLGKTITVFGCGGDRDKGKRPLMMKAALEHSDIVVVTSDNPRTEDPQSILADILSQVGNRHSNVQIIQEVDRKKAIIKSIQLASQQDVVIIAGKGHEAYQIIGTNRIHFSDYEEAQKVLNK